MENKGGIFACSIIHKEVLINNSVYCKEQPTPPGMSKVHNFPTSAQHQSHQSKSEIANEKLCLKLSLWWLSSAKHKLSQLKSHVTPYKFNSSHWLKLQHSDWKANLVKDFF